MSVYVVAQFAIRDRSRYERYAARFMDVLRSFDGRLLASDESPRVLEGEWEGDKVVLLKFPDTAAFERWATSSEYTEIAVDRIASTDGTVLLVKAPT